MAVKNDLYHATCASFLRGDRAGAVNLMRQAACRVTGAHRERLMGLIERGAVAHKPNGLIPVDAVDEERLVLAPAVAEVIDRIVAEHAASERLFSRGLRPRARLLFEGPPGNGKTIAAALLCQRLGTPAFAVPLSGVVSQYMGESGRNLIRMLEALEAGLSLVVDEFDGIASQREWGNGGGGAAREWNSIVTVLTTGLDRTTQGVLVCTTNRVDAIDPAVRRRFDVELAFPPPSEAEAKALVDHLCLRHRVTPEHVYARADGEPTIYDSYANIVRAVEDHARDVALHEVRR